MSLLESEELGGRFGGVGRTGRGGRVDGGGSWRKGRLTGCEL